MNGLTAGGMHVVGERLLLVDQGALPRAIGPVLEGRERDGVGVRHGLVLLC